MAKCTLCGKDIKWYQTTVTCDIEDCSATICKPCFKKQNELNSPNSWGKCDNCDEQFCGKHFESHPCDEESDDDSDESSDDESTEIVNVVVSKNDNFVILDYADSEDNDDPYLDDLANTIGEYLAKGYEIQGRYTDKSEVWMVKKNG